MNWVCNFNANNKSVHFLGCDIIDDGQDGSDTQDIETLNDSDRVAYRNSRTTHTTNFSN